MVDVLTIQDVFTLLGIAIPFGFLFGFAGWAASMAVRTFKKILNHA